MLQNIQSGLATDVMSNAELVNPRRVGAALRELRHERGLSQVDVVTRRGLRSANNLADVELGDRSDVLLMTVAEYCNALEVSMVDVLANLAPPSEHIAPRPERCNHVGKRFGKLVALERLPPKRGAMLWRCRCDCGNEHVARGNNLRGGRAIQCKACATEQAKRTKMAKRWPMSAAAE
jgi:transcriptional regulator with XRE-family HTH domain